ncbi:hypothetical protein, partial [Neisseria meningitidis]|uniref:hypothetical protein n=1 Tax=Neisseria meningitidis TaxID=487 RepID=UPI001C57C7CD
RIHKSQFIIEGKMYTVRLFFLALVALWSVTMVLADDTETETTTTSSIDAEGLAALLPLLNFLKAAVTNG